MSFQNYSSLANNCQNARFPFSGRVQRQHDRQRLRGRAGARLPGRAGSRRVSRPRSSRRWTSRAHARLRPAAMPGTGRSREFLRGVSLGYRRAVLRFGRGHQRRHDPRGSPVSWSYYTVVMDSALRRVRPRDRTRRTRRGFPRPTRPGFRRRPARRAADFVRLIRSYRARFRANVARTPTERAAVNWDAGHRRCAERHHGGPPQHHERDQRSVPYVGGASTIRRRTLAPDAAVHHRHGRRFGQLRGVDRAPLDERGAGNSAFFMVTPDLRFPQGATRAAQQADFAITSCETAVTGLQALLREPHRATTSSLG